MASLNQIRRLLALLDHLRAKEPYSARQLAEQLKVSRRTLFRDLKDLAKLGFEVRYDEQRGRYTVTTENADGEQTEVPTDELKALLLLGQKLDHVEPAAAAVSATLPATLPERLDLRQDGSAGPEGNVVYQRIVDALCRNCCVELMVSDPDAPPMKLRLQPYRFVFSHGRWFVAGREATSNDVRCLPLDLISSATATSDTFRPPGADEMDLAIEVAWQKDVEVGVAHEIVVRFDREVARDVASRKWFRKQELRWLDDGSLELRTHSALLDRVTAWVLSYGAKAEVISPRPLREELDARIDELCRRNPNCETSA